MRRRLTLIVALAAAATSPATAQSARSAYDSLTSAHWLGLLPAGEAKRKFILDCTGCHQFNENIAFVEGRPKSGSEFQVAIERMLGFAGGNSGFPVIAGDRDALFTALWLAQNVKRAPSRNPRAGIQLAPAESVKEYVLRNPDDLPHDVAVDARGHVVITGMMTHQMWVLDPSTAAVRSVAPPIDKSNPRATEIDAAGDWWVVFGSPQQLARYTPSSGEWKAWPVGMYPHSLALGRDGDVWFNGHFTRKPELIGRITREGKVETFEVPPHPVLADRPGGPIPYEIRTGPDGTVWGSELVGNRIYSFSPATKRFRTYDLPTTHAGPRRLDVDEKGMVWIPAYATNELLRFDPATERFTAYSLPIPDAVPYVARVDTVTHDVWVGTSAADAVLRFTPATQAFTVYPLPSRGALVRHLAIDSRTHEVWAAYGAWPGRLPAIVARIKP